ncbi:DNA-directed RNA polymerase subunit omega [bacterium]|nr:DNA-directed RNA polymerase subunit omega [bacterium]
MEDKTESAAGLDDLNLYETVILAAKRARQINQLRVLKQKQTEYKIIEREKPTTLALKQIIDGDITYRYSSTDEKKEEEKKEQQRPRGLKTVF